MLCETLSLFRGRTSYLVNSPAASISKLLWLDRALCVSKIPKKNKKQCVLCYMPHHRAGNASRQGCDETGGMCMQVREQQLICMIRSLAARGMNHGDIIDFTADHDVSRSALIILHCTICSVSRFELNRTRASFFRFEQV